MFKNIHPDVKLIAKVVVVRIIVPVAATAIALYVAKKIENS